MNATPRPPPRGGPGVDEIGRETGFRGSGADRRIGGRRRVAPRHRPAPTDPLAGIAGGRADPDIGGTELGIEDAHGIRTAMTVMDLDGIEHLSYPAIVRLLDAARSDPRILVGVRSSPFSLEYDGPAWSVIERCRRRSRPPAPGRSRVRMALGSIR